MKKYNDLKGLNGNVRTSIVTLINSGMVRTGKSGYSKGWANKSVWTAGVIAACNERGIIIESGNDAPNNGANGEYVRLVADKRKNRQIWADMKAEKVAAIEAKKKADQAKADLVAWLNENKGKVTKNEGESWSEAITSALIAAGFKSWDMSFNSMKTILFNH